MIKKSQRERSLSFDRGRLFSSRGCRRGAVWMLLLVAGAGLSVSPQLSVPAQELADRPPLASWLAQTRREITATEYEITWQGATGLEDLGSAYQAPNRAHNLRTYFSGNGIRVLPRTAEGSSWTWGLMLTGYGRRGAMVSAQPASLQPDGKRIEYRRGDIFEWYVNDPKGVEQGFTLTHPIPHHDSAGLTRREAGDPVVIELALSGTLSAFPSKDARSIEFRTPQGLCALSYSALHVVDASGRELPAHMEAFAEANVRGVRLVFDDAGATYPVVVDPIVSSPPWRMEAEQAGAQFGYSVAPAGDVNGDGYSDVVIGAWTYDAGQTDEGRAYVFLGSASGLSNTVHWSADGEQTGAYFGYSVGGAGDVNGDGFGDVIVGAEALDAPTVNEGGAIVYHGSASGLSQTAAWTGESNNEEAHYGVSVAGAGDVNGDGYDDVIVGAPRDERNQVDEGRAWVYLGSASGLAGNAVWVGEGNQGSANFGQSVATAGDVNADGYADILVGAPMYDNGSDLDAGRALVFLGTSSGPSTSAIWALVGVDAGSFFGQSVATAGDTDGDGYADIAIGEYGYDNGQTNEGRVLVYRGSASGPQQTPSWSIEGNEGASRLGWSVATAGDTNGDGYADLIVGAFRANDGATVDPGKAMLFQGSPVGLENTPAWTGYGENAGDFYGHSVATAGDVDGDGFSEIVVGAPSYTNDEAGEGAAYVHRGSPSLPLETPAWTTEGNMTQAYYGRQVASAGDVNGDGYSDVIVAMPQLLNQGTGRAVAFLGSASGMATTPSWTRSGVDSEHSRFGASVASAGDVNGDGYSDVIVGDSGIRTVYVFHGSAAGLSTSASGTIVSGTANFGDVVASAGDVNGDGYSDVVVSANAMVVYAYHGSASGVQTSAAWTVASQPGNGFGAAVGSAGDVNGDGYSDIIIGADHHDNPESDEGRAYVYLGSPSGLMESPVWTLESNQPSALFGHSVATAGDVNGDGYSDVIVGAPDYDSSGFAFVYLGTPTGPAANPAWAVTINQSNAGFGRSVATAGDVNSDGYSDVIVGAPSYDVGPTDRGAAFVYVGSASGLATDPIWAAGGTQQFSNFGGSVAAAGDVNGDGFGDLLVGDSGITNPEPDEGCAYFYYGGGVEGPDLIPRQTRLDASAPIDLFGKSDSETGFRVRMLGRTPAGRGRVRMQVEAKPLGTSFNATGLVGSPSQTTGAPSADGSSVSFEIPVTGLIEGTFYHWRSRIVSSDPFFPRSRWVSLPRNGVTETKLRTAGCVDRDGDGFGAFADPSCIGAVDCADSNSGAWNRPGETRDLLFTTKTMLNWSSPMNSGGTTALTYDSLRSTTASNFTAAGVCVETQGADMSTIDTTDPSTGQLFFYLTRAQNVCPEAMGTGSLGSKSSGAERPGRTCP